MEYSSEVLRRFGSRAMKQPEPGQGSVVSGEAEDRTLGVWVRFVLEIDDDVVARAGYEVFGCPHAVAAADWIAEWLAGRPIDAVGRLDVHDVAKRLGVPVHKLGKLLRIEDALLACTDQLTDPGSEGKQ